MASDLEFRASREERSPSYPQLPMAEDPVDGGTVMGLEALMLAGLISTTLMVSCRRNKPVEAAGGPARISTMQGNEQPPEGGLQPLPPPPPPPPGNLQPPLPPRPSRGKSNTRVDVAPIILTKAPFPTLSKEAFPPQMKGRRIKVVVKVWVDEKGQPTKATVLESGNSTPEICRLANQAAFNSQYAPGLQSGRPAAGWCTASYRITLNADPSSNGR